MYLFFNPHIPRPSPPKPFVPSFEQLRLKIQEKDAAIEHRLRPKRRPAPSTLPPEDEAAVNNFLAKKGVVSRFMREQVTDKDISRLKPRQWLNDEVLNFYGQLLMSRAEACKADPGGADTVGGKPLNVHYFSTFFWAKLMSDGYEKGRLAKWTKKASFIVLDIVDTCNQWPLV
jgi:sentrin-specific protease 1